jgi:death on curing protein
MNSPWVWIRPDVLLAVHEEQLAGHGGASGTRDAGLFESALARPQNLAVYDDPDAQARAASYAVALAKNYPWQPRRTRPRAVAARAHPPPLNPS